MTEGTKKPRNEKPTRKRRLYLGLITYQGGDTQAKLTAAKREAEAWAELWSQRAKAWPPYWRAEIRTFIKSERGNFYKEREDLRKTWGPLETAKPGADLPRGSMRSTDQENLAEPMTEKEMLADMFQGNQEALDFMDELDELDRMTEQMNQNGKAKT